jgi:hypothetical protein
VIGHLLVGGVDVRFIGMGLAHLQELALQALYLQTWMGSRS